MDPKRTGTALIALLVVLSLGWGGMYYYAKRAEVSTGQPQPAAPAERLEGITIRHKADGDMHTYTGTIETPTPCHSIAASLSVNYSEPPQGIITITTEESSEGVCAQVMASQEFSVSLSSDEAPELQVIVDGKARQVAVVEAQ